VLASGWLVRAIGASPVAAPYGELYLRISMAGVPAMLLTFAGTGYLRGQRDTRTPLYVALGTNVLNLALELLLIVGLGRGVGASALATVFAQWIGAALYLRRIIGPAHSLGVDLRPHLASLRKLAVVARDLFVRGVALRTSFLVGTALAARIGTAEVGAYEIAFEIWTFLALALDAIAIAGQALIGTELGAGRRERAQELGDRMLVLGAGFGVACGVLIAATRTVLPHLFSTDPVVLHLTGFLLWIVAVMQPVGALVFVLDGLLIGAGDQRFLARAMVFAAAVMGVSAGVVVWFDLGLGWVWGALCAFVVARWLPLHSRFRSREWAGS
jgi:putative MATE family efflux protein